MVVVKKRLDKRASARNHFGHSAMGRAASQSTKLTVKSGYELDIKPFWFVQERARADGAGGLGGGQRQHSGNSNIPANKPQLLIYNRKVQF